MKRKFNNSEIHETKKYYEVPSEKVQEWSDTIADLTKQNQQFKAERDKFEQMLNEECERGYQMEGKYRGMKVERDSLITDLDVLRKNKLEYEEQVGVKTMLKFIMFIIVFLILSAVLKTILF